MKRLAFILMLSLITGTLFAQESAKLFNAGNDALKAKDYAKALDNYEKAQAVWGTAPQDYGMLFNCGICAIQIKNYDKAIKYFDLCYKNNFKPEDALYYKAVLNKMLKHEDVYLKTLEEGIAKFPGNARFKSEISKNCFAEGVSHYNAGNTILKGAVDKINAKKYKDANDPGYKAEVAKAKKEFSDAIPSFDKATELDPANAKAKEIKEACEKQVKAL
jgi:tetratricopeptide (TPR) repeat protein